jgi:hypothetical protein
MPSRMTVATIAALPGSSVEFSLSSLTVTV